MKRPSLSATPSKTRPAATRMCALTGWLSSIVSHYGRRAAHFFERPADSPVQPSLTVACRAIADAGAVVEQQFDSLRSLKGLIGRIEDELSREWCEREQTAGAYYGMLRGLLEILDECENVKDGDLDLGMVRSRLERAIRDQGVEAIAVMPGERFCSATQTPGAIEETDELAPGTVLRLLETGYQRRLADGSTVVVRPARVVVSGPKGDSRESNDEKGPFHDDRD